jgi:serine phosphatase RsbU (regulator of sigma subunit)/pSer/pThr/pTyr-binding forkhead associated (FHA) protein
VAILRVLRGTAAGAVFELQGERTVIGRHPNCGVVLDNGAVSRHHVQILESHGSYYVEDLRSRNGTTLNNLPLEGRAELHDGDQIRVCDITLEFELHGSSSKLRGSRAAEVETSLGERVTDEQPVADGSALYGDEVELSTPVKFESSSVLGKIDARRGAEEGAALHPELKLHAVLEITRALGRELEVDAVLPKVLSALFQIFPQAAQGFVLLKDSESGKLLVKGTRVRKGSEAESVAVSMTVVRQAMESGQALLSTNVLDDSRFKQSASLNKLQIRSVMCAPLMGYENEAIGVIQIVTRGAKDVFSNDDLDLLVSVASQAALAIENATLHEEVMRQRELERDLEFATQVQLGFLPKARPRIKPYAFADYYEAALRIGGDYFDYVTMPGGRIAVTLGDVAGKGMPAALLMARLYSSARYQLLTSESLSEAVAGLNREIASSGLGHRFITFLVLLLDPATHDVTLVNAGHLAPLVRRRSGLVEQVGRADSGLPLGIVPDQEYNETKFTLEAGDSVIAYTDGVTEAMNGHREIYGRPRLEACVEKSRGDIDALVKAIISDVELFVGENALRDDTCIVGLQRLPE